MNAEKEGGSIGKNDGDSQKSKQSLNSQKRKSQKSKKSQDVVVHATNKNIQLLEDDFGYVVDEEGKQHYIKRFTWRNHNSIQVQVITYGARITSLKLPNRKGLVEDVVLGFDDIAGYLQYDNLYMGATIGRVADEIEKATFVIDKKQYWLTANKELNHFNGGFKGLDKVVWIPYVDNTSVVLRYVSRDLDDGYPGDLFLEIRFELSTKNEFHINMEARTTKPTIVNLSNLLYFNLGGHGGNREEMLKHIVCTNANCGLLLLENGLPSGKIQNVIYTRDDFQIPRLMKDAIPTELDDGFDSYLCVNRATGQDLCFAARAMHPTSGRVLEMYSNQSGVYFSTANHFDAAVRKLSIPVAPSPKCSEMTGGIFELLERLHGHVAETLTIDSRTNYSGLKVLICKIKKRMEFQNFGEEEEGEEEEIEQAVEEEFLGEEGEEEEDETKNIILSPNQLKYLEGMYNVLSERASITSYTQVGVIIKKILDTATIVEPEESTPEPSVKSATEILGEARSRSIQEQLSKENSELERKGSIRLENRIPSFYKDGRLHGKNDAIYKKQGGMCFQSGNYPNAIYHKNFPNSILRPGETYKHNIVYKFWVQSGSPTRWIRRNFPPPHKK